MLCPEGDGRKAAPAGDAQLYIRCVGIPGDFEPKFPLFIEKNYGKMVTGTAQKGRSSAVWQKGAKSNEKVRRDTLGKIHDHDMRDDPSDRGGFFLRNSLYQ